MSATGRQETTGQDEAARQDEAAGRYETRCRQLLRAYPRSWRAHREQEILGVLMAMHDQQGDHRDDHRDEHRDEHRDDWRADRRVAHRPSWGVHVDLLAGGLETRWEQTFSVIPTLIRDRIAVLGLVLGAAVCTVIVAFAEIAWPWRPDQFITLADGSTVTYTAPVVQTAGPLLYGLWILALAAAIAGRGRWGRWLLAVFAVAALLLSVVRVIPHPPVYALVPLALAAGLSTMGHLPTARTTRGWMAAVYIGLTGALAATQLSHGDGSPVWNPVSHFYRPGYADQGMHSLSVALLALAGLGVITAAIASLTGRRWFVATLVTALPYLYLVLFAFSGVDRHQMLSAAALLSAVLLLAIALVLAGARWGRGVSPHSSPQRDASAPTEPREPLL